MGKKHTPAERAEAEIERAWRGQYGARSEAALAECLATRCAELGEPHVRRATIIEELWRIVAEGPSTDRTAKLDALASISEALGDFRFAAIARYAQARAQAIGAAHDPEQEIELLARALELLSKRGKARDFDVAIFTNGLATLHYSCGRWIDALEHFFRAEASALGSGEMGLAAMIQNNLGSLSFFIGNVHGAKKSFESALESAREAKAEFIYPVIYRNLGEIHYRLGSYDEALAWLEPVTTGEMAASVREKSVWSVAALAAIGAGRLDMARELTGKALSKAAEAGDAKTRSLAILAAGKLALAEGRLVDAKHNMAKAREEAKRASERYYELDAIASLAESVVAAGDDEAAKAYLAEELVLRGELLGIAADSRENARAARRHLEELVSRPSRRHERESPLPGLASLRVREVESAASRRRTKVGKLVTAFAHQFSTPLDAITRKARERVAVARRADGKTPTGAPHEASLAGRELVELERACARLRSIASGGAIERTRLSKLAAKVAASAARRSAGSAPRVDGDAELETDQLALAYLFEALFALASDDSAEAPRLAIEPRPEIEGARLTLDARGCALEPAARAEAAKPIEMPYDFASGGDIGWRIARTLVEKALEGSFDLSFGGDGSWTLAITLPGMARE
jgi:tetratricopeptide (TPR) repeat protein